MKIDLHVHIRRKESLKELRSILRARKLDGIAVTNFYNVSFAYFIRERLPEFTIIIGQEVDSTAGHILAIDIREQIPDRLSPAETIQRIHAQNGLAILPHPFLIRRSVMYYARWPRLPFDAVETFNWRCGPFLWPNMLAALAFSASALPKVATTDSKRMETIGKCYVEAPGETGAEFLDRIRRGEHTVHVEKNRPSTQWVRRQFSQIFQPHRHYVCLICGERLYFHALPQSRRCEHCGRSEIRFTTCRQPHYLCGPCRTRRAFSEEELKRYRLRRNVEV